MTIADLIKMLETMQSAARRRREDALVCVRNAVLGGDGDSDGAKEDAVESLREEGALDARQHVLELLATVEVPAAPAAPATPTIPDGWPPGWELGGSPNLWTGDGASMDVFLDGWTLRVPVHDGLDGRLRLARALAWTIHCHTNPVEGK